MLLVRNSLCLIGSQKPYPAYDSVFSICQAILGKENLLELRMPNPVYSMPPPLFRPFLSILQDLLLLLRVFALNKETPFKVLLIFQGYWPLTCMGIRLLSKIRIALYIGGSGFEWSRTENNSLLYGILVYGNLLIERICHEMSFALITLSPRMVEMIGGNKFAFKTMFALPRLDKEFFKEFRVIKKLLNRNNTIGFVGTLCKRKGILNLVDAIPAIIEKNGSDVVIVGDGPLMEIARRAVQSFGVDKSVKITGFVDYSSLRSYYNKMKLLVVPSYAEGIPSTIFEAIACGTPVLATSVGGIPDVIVNFQTGFIMKSNNSDCIAQSVTQILDNPDLLQKVSSNATSLFSGDFSEKRIYDSWIVIFDRLGLQENVKHI